MAVPTSGQGAGNRRSRSRPYRRKATANFSASGTRIATPNGTALHVFEMSSNSRNRAGRTTPESCQIAFKKGP
jgi:hypothetical protein